MEVDSELSSYSSTMDNTYIQLTEVPMDAISHTSEGSSFTTLQTVGNYDIQENSDSETETIPVKRTKEEEQVLTNKFLTGELSFSEYAAQYGENDFEEAVEDEDIDEKSEEPGPSVDINNFEKSLAKIKEKSATRKKFRGRIMKSRNSLPLALKGLMGEANLRYARGEHESAVKMCFEVIRQFPWAPEPFETLASLYDEKGDSEKALQISLVAAHLNPRASKNLWMNLAEKSEDKGDIKQAITCYGKAILADSKDIELHLKQAELYESSGDKKSSLKAYFRLLRCVEARHGERLIAVAKMLAERHHEDSELPKAKEALQVVFDKCPQLVTSELVNIMLEVLIGLKDFKTSLEILTKFCQVEVTLDCLNDKYSILKCIVPDDLVVDILAKTIIISIHLHAFHLLDYFLGKIKSLNPEEAGDVYFDVAEALMGEQKFHEAMELLTPLTQSNNYNLPAIWLKIAECYRALNRVQEAIRAYMVVVERAPQLLVARFAVSDLLNKQGKRNEALDVLTQDEDSETLNSALLYERTLLLQNIPEQKEQFVAVAQLFLGRHFAHINTKDDLHALTTLKTDRKKTVLKESKTIHKSFIQGDEHKGEFSQAFNEPPIDEEWQLFKSVCETCLELKKFDTLERIVFSAQGSQRFSKYSFEIDLLCLSACYYNSDAYFGYNMVRSLVLKNINCERSWNIFNMMILRADDSRHNRFLMRLLIRNPHHNALTVLHANNCLVAGTYKYALSDYTAVFQREHSAMMAFLIGVTLCQMACQKFSAKKHSLVTQSAGYFWKYKDLRGPEGLQESHYNIGRALHQLGLLPPAIHHYKKALEVKHKFIDDNAKYLNLQREAAFNLHLIYLSSGAKDIARMYLEKYIVI